MACEQGDPLNRRGLLYSELEYNGDNVSSCNFYHFYSANSVPANILQPIKVWNLAFFASGCCPYQLPADLRPCFLMNSSQLHQFWYCCYSVTLGNGWSLRQDPFVPLHCSALVCHDGVFGMTAPKMLCIDSTKRYFPAVPIQHTFSEFKWLVTCPILSEQAGTLFCPLLLTTT